MMQRTERNVALVQCAHRRHKSNALALNKRLVSPRLEFI